MSPNKITTFLWFNGKAEEAAKHYVSIFGGEDSKITNTHYYTEAGQVCNPHEPGTVLTVEFELRGHQFVALNGGPAEWKFSEAVSFHIDCDDQAEVDHFWDRLGEGGNDARKNCGWVTDKYGVVWQVVPRALGKMLKSTDKAARNRVMNKMVTMKKLDIAPLEEAFAG